MPSISLGTMSGMSESASSTRITLSKRSVDLEASYARRALCSRPVGDAGLLIHVKARSRRWAILGA
jgi:hypothetical protein